MHNAWSNGNSGGALCCGSASSTDVCDVAVAALYGADCCSAKLAGFLNTYMLFVGVSRVVAAVLAGTATDAVVIIGRVKPQTSAVLPLCSRGRMGADACTGGLSDCTADPATCLGAIEVDGWHPLLPVAAFMLLACRGDCALANLFQDCSTFVTLIL